MSILPLNDCVQSYMINKKKAYLNKVMKNQCHHLTEEQ